MKQIVNGILYDTRGSENLGAWWASCPMDDPRYYEEQLFRMPNGRYFLLGTGNEGSFYGDMPVPPGEFSAWHIVPIKKAYARRWAKEKLNIDL